MKQIKLNKKTIIIALILIILIQTMAYAIVASNKHYIHMDEGYSYGLINYDKLDISWNEGFYNIWHDSQYYTDYLIINEEEKMDWTPVYEQQKNDVHPPFYYFLLRIANSFSIGHFSIWPGIILNMIIHIGITIFTYLISSKLFKNKVYGLITALVGGLTVATFAMVLYTRMYALAALMVLATTYVHMINLEKDKLTIKNLVPIGICAILGSLTQYYYLIYLGIMYLVYLIRYIIKKQYKNSIRYTIAMLVSAGISLLIFPYSIAHIFIGYRGQGMFSNLTNPTFAWEGIGKYSGITIMDAFNGFLIVMFIITLAILIYEYIKKREIKIRLTNKELGLILLPTLAYFLVIAMGTPYKEIRYLIPIIPILFIIGSYGFKIVLEKVFNKSKTNIVMALSAFIIIISPVVFNLNITYQYSDMKDIVNEMEEMHATPALFVFNTSCNRFMDDIYLFTKLDKSYIMDSEFANKDKIKETLEQVDITKGLILFINANLENDDYINMIIEGTQLNTCEYMKRLNACDVYYLY